MVKDMQCPTGCIALNLQLVSIKCSSHSLTFDFIFRIHMVNEVGLSYLCQNQVKYENSQLYSFHMQFFMHFLACGYFTLPGDRIQNHHRKKKWKKYIFIALKSVYSPVTCLLGIYIFFHCCKYIKSPAKQKRVLDSCWFFISHFRFWMSLWMSN